MAKRKPSPQTSFVEAYDGRRQTLPAKTPRDRLDELIDWYEKNKPDMPHVMPGGVYMTKEELDSFAGKGPREGEWMYRTWRLTRAEIPAKASERMKIAK